MIKNGFYKMLCLASALCWMSQTPLLAQEHPSYIITRSVSQEIAKALPGFKDLAPDLYKLKFALPKETVYELVATQEGLGWSFAIADIIQSEPHFHNYTSETYTVVTGILEVTIDNKPYILHPGDVVTIPIKTIHWARSLTDQPARILVSAIPGWTLEDHHLANRGSHE